MLVLNLGIQIDIRRTLSIVPGNRRLPKGRANSGRGFLLELGNGQVCLDNIRLLSN